MREQVESMGGRLICWYLSFGEYDGLTIYEAPDDATAGAVVLAAARACLQNAGAGTLVA